MKRNVLFVVLLLVIAGCSSNAATETITDQNTPSTVATVDGVESHMITHQHMYDNMDRGNHEYDDKPLVIASNLSASDLTRGDVVFFNNTNDEKTISRVVALPGEKVSVKKGTVYIDGKMLDTFYGTSKRAGLDKEAYFEKMDDAGNDYNKEEATKTFELNTEEVKLGENEYYLIDDDWLRGKMTLLKEDDFIGKVIGYGK